MVQKASTPWSTRTVAEGGTDSPVGDLVPIPDKITPVVNTGFIALTGKFRGIPSDDLTFTFQDPSQAMGAGAAIVIEGINMLNHDALIVAILDSSGNNINIDLRWTNPGILQGPYTAFADVGVNASFLWRGNEPGDSTGGIFPILEDGGEDLATTWEFFKISHLRGTIGNFRMVSNEGADAGTISTAYLRLV